MLFPKKVKHRKWQTGRENEAKRRNRTATRGVTLAFGSHGLKADSSERISSNQIEAARRALTRSITKTGKVWIRIFPDRPITKKAAEVGMGKGKGELEKYVATVRPGRVIFEVDGVKPAVAREGLRKAGAKLPIKTRIVSREE